MRSRSITSFLLVATLFLTACQPTVNQTAISASQSATNRQRKDFAMQLTSDDFNHQTPIPGKYTCDGNNVNPPLTISNAPEDTQSFALIVDDPDATDDTFTHWLLWNIPANTTTINQASTPPEAIIGTNSFGNQQYDGPCPPSGIHRYFFTLFALNTTLDLKASSQKEDLLGALDNHIIEETQLIGTYSQE